MIIKNTQERMVDAIMSDVYISDNHGDLKPIIIKMSDDYSVFMPLIVEQSTLIDVIDQLETCIVNLKYQLTDEEIMSQRRRELK